MSQVRPCRRSRWLSITPLVAILAGLLPAAAFGAAERPTFYEPPVPLGPGAPGDVIRSERLSFQGITRPPAGTVGYRMLYRSTTALGEPVAVSGSVLLPPGDASSRPIVGVGVGNHGIGDSCAPSRLLAAGAEPDLRTMSDLLRRGYAVAVTDYQGLGTPGDHAFGVNVALGRNVLDAIRAARNLPGTGLPTDGKTAVIGFSQGGGAVGSAGEQAPVYAPDVKLSGIVAGAMLSDPGSQARYLDGGLFFGVLLAAALGYDASYPELALQSYLNPAGKWLYKQKRDLCQQLVPAFTMQRISWYAKSNPLKTAPWKARLLENQVGNGMPDAPAYLYHGQLDEALSWHQTTGVRRRWCAQGKGANVKFTMVALGEHFTTQLVQEPRAIDWLARRLEGVPAPRAC